MNNRVDNVEWEFKIKDGVRISSKHFCADGKEGVGVARKSKDGMFSNSDGSQTFGPSGVYWHCLNCGSRVFGARVFARDAFDND